MGLMKNNQKNNSETRTAYNTIWKTILLQAVSLYQNS